jgi:uncharacterized protein YoxC
MTLLAQAIVVACIVVLTAVLVPTLLALKKAALRAESVLAEVEREIRPMANQLESLADELGRLSHGATEELARVGVVVRRLEEVTTKVAILMGIVGGLTRVGRAVGVAAGVKKGLDVFIKRLSDKP